MLHITNLMTDFVWLVIKLVSDCYCISFTSFCLLLNLPMIHVVKPLSESLHLVNIYTSIRSCSSENSAVFNIPIIIPISYQCFPVHSISLGGVNRLVNLVNGDNLLLPAITLNCI